MENLKITEAPDRQNALNGNVGSNSDFSKTLIRIVMDSAEKTQFPCEHCGRLFKSKGGYTNHLKKCKLKTVANSVIEIDHEQFAVSNANNPDPGTNDEIPFDEETFHWG